MIKEFIKKILWGYRATSDTYVKFLKKKGITIGDNIEICFPRDTFIDYLNPHLLSIGSYVSMTGPVTILTHDYSVCVLKKWTKGEVLGKQQETIIGNNVFLGWGCTILPGTQIGDNVIIGANAVVSGVIENNTVYAGNPAKKICTIEEYYCKRKGAQIEEAKRIYILYKNRFNVEPTEEIFHEYFMLFSRGNKENLIEKFQNKLCDHGNEDESIEYLQNNKPIFSSFEEFKNFIEKE